MNPASPEPMLAVRGLHVSFRHGGHDTTVVDDVDFDLAPGEIVGLVGESGCGKSATAAALLGMVPVPSGTVKAAQMTLNGADLTALDEPGWRRLRGRQIAAIFQEPLTALDPVFTIGDQLTEVLRRHRGHHRKEARAVARTLLLAAGIADQNRVLDLYAHQLSGGMRQRVMIAMAMSCQPRLLIADEPTTALDVTTQGQILQQIEDSAKNTGTTVLLISHDLGVIAQVCERAMVMYCGQIVEEGPVQELFTHPRHPYTAGLLAARPVVSRGAVIPVLPIPGSVPSPSRMPDGCRFNNRCTRADTTCKQQRPPLRQVSGSANHRFACFHPLDCASR